MTDLPIYVHPCENLVSRTKRFGNSSLNEGEFKHNLFIEHSVNTDNDSDDAIDFHDFCLGLLAYKLCHETMQSNIQRIKRNINSLLPPNQETY